MSEDYKFSVVESIYLRQFALGRYRWSKPGFMPRARARRNLDALQQATPIMDAAI